MVVRWIDGFQLCGKYERGGNLGERKPVQARLPCEIWKNLDLNRPDALMYSKKGVVLWESYYWLNDHLRGQQKKL